MTNYRRCQSLLLQQRVMQMEIQKQKSKYPGCDISISTLGDLAALVVMTPDGAFIDWTASQSTEQAKRVLWAEDMRIPPIQRRLMGLGPEDRLPPVMETSLVKSVGACRGTHIWVHEGLAIPLMAAQMPNEFAQVWIEALLNIPYFHVHLLQPIC